MLVYRASRRHIDPRQALGEIEERLLASTRHGGPTHEDWVSLTIDAGVVESAVVDADAPDADRDSDVSRVLRRLSIALADGLVRSWRADSAAEGQLAAARHVLTDARRIVPAGAVAAGVPEGYAYYGLYPETYAQAAEMFCDTCTPARVTAIGIRSIGTSLSAVVVAMLGARGVAAESLTVRPRGHPFERQLELEPALVARLSAAARRQDHWFAIVDEGPGLSGSSFASVAEALAGLGVPDDHIVIFPSWDPDPKLLRSARAQQQWHRHRRFTGDFDTIWLKSGRLTAPFDACLQSDISAGAWRQLLFASEREYPATQPQHERRKLLCRSRDGRALLLKFEGLGHFGAARLPLACELADAGFAPPARGFANGFLATDWVDGRPLASSDVDPGFLAHVARYIGWRQRHARAEADVGLDALLEMIRVNVGEALVAADTSWEAELARLAECVRRVPTVRVDGRMAPHEWLRTSAGYVKTDGLSHHDDHFYPGPQDAAWDLAGAAVELSLTEDAERALVQRYVLHTDDAHVAQRLPFWRIAYLAFRLGYATLAEGALAGTADGARVVERSSFYRERLAVALEALADSRTSAAPR